MHSRAEKRLLVESIVHRDIGFFIAGEERR